LRNGNSSLSIDTVLVSIARDSTFFSDMRQSGRFSGFRDLPPSLRDAPCQGTILSAGCQTFNWHADCSY
jgi:hypothetical protein